MHTVLQALDQSEFRRISSTLRKGGLGRATYIWNRIEPMVRLQAMIRPGSPFSIRHFELCVVPVVVSITRRTVTALMEFFSVPLAPDAESQNSFDGRALLLGGDARAAAPSAAVEASPQSLETSQPQPDSTVSSERNILTDEMYVQYLRLGQLVAFISYRGENWGRLEDFDSLQVNCFMLPLNI